MFGSEEANSATGVGSPSATLQGLVRVAVEGYIIPSIFYLGRN